MTRTNKGFVSLCIPLIAILLIFNSCEDPGSVGSDYVERPTLTFDTLNISQTEVLSFQGYSGRLGFIPIGQYSDAIFGDIEASGLLKPTRTPPIPDTVDLAQDFNVKLELSIDSLESYGDTLSESSFSLYEITTPWRGSALKIDDEIQYGNLVGSFDVGSEKELIVDLSQSWVDKYKSFYFSDEANIDSTYNYEFGGLAIVSDQQNTKISFPRSDGSRFLIINGAASDTADTVNIPLRDWGFTLDRAGAISPTNTFPLHTTLEGMLGITMPLTLLREENKTKNIIRADIVFYEAEEILNENLPENHLRLGVTSVNLDLKEQIEPVYEYQFGSVDFFGAAIEDESYFQLNVTNYVNDVIFGSETREELVLGIGSTSGALRSTLLYDETAPEQFRPKIIITSLVD